ncbi:hypothetical protein KVR01_002480 [Diaporthe batatas]|uniref:uncharacterized protein n=1 Tax=Diaporthe batatas TaxID=748121 RepID=UPI001D049DBA|nr:uncharacterized protein KVR01_002480 [Diaporthe batatas]KAG8166791.1 hypothetical protein KVR01_002480 [Diaporthe batatas]
MPEHHELDIAALLLLLAKKAGAASIGTKLQLRQDDDGIDTPDDDDDAVPVPAPAPTTTDPATATTSAASTSTDAASSARSLDTGSKAGIAIGVIVFVIFLGGVVFMYWRRRGRRWGRRNKNNNNNNSNNNNNNSNNNNHEGHYPNQPNMAMTAHNVARKSVSDSSPPLGSISPPSTNPDAGRPWFDNGHGSSELPSREARDGVGGWVYDKAELSAPEAGSAQEAPGRPHPHHQYHQYSNSTELPTAGNQIHEIPEASACSYAPVELPAAMPDHSFRYSGFTGFSGGEGEDIGRNASTRTSNTDGSANRRESLAPTFTVSSPATTVAETVSDSGYGNQVSPASPYARSAAGGNTM